MNLQKFVKKASICAMHEEANGSTAICYYRSPYLSFCAAHFSLRFVDPRYVLTCICGNTIFSFFFGMKYYF